MNFLDIIRNNPPSQLLSIKAAVEHNGKTLRGKFEDDVIFISISFSTDKKIDRLEVGYRVKDKDNRLVREYINVSDKLFTIKAVKLFGKILTEFDASFVEWVLTRIGNSFIDCLTSETFNLLKATPNTKHVVVDALSLGGVKFNHSSDSWSILNYEWLPADLQNELVKALLFKY